MNKEVKIYWKSQSCTLLDDCLFVYQGIVRRFDHTAETVTLQLEDLTEKKLHKDLPSTFVDVSDIELYNKDNGEYIPITYGVVKNAPIRITSINMEDDETLGTLELKADTLPLYGYSGHNPLKVLLNDRYLNVLREFMETFDSHPEFYNDYHTQYRDNSENNGVFIDLIFNGDNDGNYKSNLAGNNEAQVIHFDRLPEGISVSNPNPSSEITQTQIDGIFGENNEIAQSFANNDWDINGLDTISNAIDGDKNTFADLICRDILIANCNNLNNPSFNFIRQYGTVDFKLATIDNSDIISGILYKLRIIGEVEDVDSTNSSLGNIGRLKYMLANEDYTTQISSDKEYGYENPYDLEGVLIGNVFLPFEYTKKTNDLYQFLSFQLIPKNDGSNNVHDAHIRLNDIRTDVLFDIENYFNKTFSIDIKGRIDISGNLIQNPAAIIKDILDKELSLTIQHTDTNYIEALNIADGLKFGFSVDKKVNSKRLIAGIASNTRFVPVFTLNGFSLKSIKDRYILGDSLEIKNSDIIKYSFSRTKIEDVKSKVSLKYFYDYEQDSNIKSIDLTIEDLDIIGWGGYDYYNFSKYDSQGGITHPNSTLEFEANYIQDKETAEDLSKFLLHWYRNQHTKFKLTLPLSYLYLEVGDVVRFDSLLDDMKAYGEDYTQMQERNNQWIYPAFMITSLNKNPDKVEVEAIQLHYHGVDSNYGWNLEVEEEGEDFVQFFGDVNQDGEINVIDIIMILNHIMGISYLTSTQYNIADVNQDGIVNIIDIVAVVNIIIEEDPPEGVPIHPEVEVSTHFTGGDYDPDLEQGDDGFEEFGTFLNIDIIDLLSDTSGEIETHEWVGFRRITQWTTSPLVGGTTLISESIDLNWEGTMIGQGTSSIEWNPSSDLWGDVYNDLPNIQQIFWHRGSNDAGTINSIIVINFFSGLQDNYGNLVTSATVDIDGVQTIVGIDDNVPYTIYIYDTGNMPYWLAPYIELDEDEEKLEE